MSPVYMVLMNLEYLRGKLNSNSRGFEILTREWDLHNSGLLNF